MGKSRRKEKLKNKNKLIILILLIFVCLLLILQIVKIKENYEKNKFVEKINKSAQIYRNIKETYKEDISKIDIKDKKIYIKDNDLISGTLMSINKNDIEVFYVTDGKYCASGNLENLVINKGKCNVSKEDETIMKTYIFGIDTSKKEDEPTVKNIKILNEKEIIINNPKIEEDEFRGWKIKVTANIYNDDDTFLTTNMKAIWNDSKDEIEKSSDVKEIKDIYVNEKNKIKKVEIIIDPQGGKLNNSKEIKNITLNNDDEITIDIPIKEGYIFDGWKSVSNINENQDIITKFTAMYKKDLHTLEIDLNGGKSSQRKTYSLIKGEQIILEVPKKEGHIFYKWEITDTTAKLIDNKLIMGEKDTVLKAIWIKNEYELEVNLDGGNVQNEIKNKLKPNEKIILETPQKSGYKFIGWNVQGKNSTISNNILTMGIEKTKITATWKAINYSIDYNLNGGNAYNKSSYTIETQTFKLNNPVKEHYYFNGWIEEGTKDLKLNVYIKKGETGNKKYQAYWRPIDYEIEYELNGGVENKKLVKKYTIENDVDLLNPVKKGYIFEGWYNNKNFDGDKISKIKKGETGNKKYYAKWSLKEYIISYNLKEDEIQEESIAVYKYNITDEFELPTPKKEGYKFEGWYTNKEFNSKSYVDIKKGTTDNLNFYPKWSKYEEQNNINIYDFITKDAVRDDIQSQFVTGKNGIDFSKNSAINNGQGIYITSESSNDEIPIYYYRGNVENNNVIFAEICWKMVRTTETKGIKLIYNGKPSEGKCNSQGAQTQITKYAYNNAGNTSGGGYKYGDVQSLSKIAITSNMILAKDVEYIDGTYYLKDTYVIDSDPSNDWYETVDKYRYSCLSEKDDSCNSVTYFYFSRNNKGVFESYGISLTNNIKPKDIIEKTTINSSNEKDSKMKEYVEKWYKENLLQYENQIEDTIYCNDRSISNFSGWDKNGSILTPLYFDSYYRNAVNYKPSLICVNKNDRFTKNKTIGNGMLNYPIGLLTIDEISFVGYSWWNNYRTNNYLYTGQILWTMSPAMISAGSTYSFVAYSMTDSVNVSSKYGVRPVISLKYQSTIKQGNGTTNNPFVIQ